MTSRAGCDLLKHVEKLFSRFALSWSVEVVTLLWERVGMDEVCLRRYFVAFQNCLLL